MRLPLVCFGALLATLVGGCGDNFGERCALPRLVEENCRSRQPDSSTNCIMTDNLACDSKICAVYQDSHPFCTTTCEADSDCPEEFRCAPFFIDTETDRFCVAQGAQAPVSDSQ